MNLLFDLEGTLLNARLPGVDWKNELAELAKAHTLYIVTSKPTKSAEKDIAEQGWQPFFIGVIGRDFFRGANSKAESVAFLIEKESLDDGETVMIGDRPHDMEAGRGNSVCALGVLWGNGEREELLEAGADYLCESFAEFKATIEFLAEEEGS